MNNKICVGNNVVKLVTLLPDSLLDDEFELSSTQDVRHQSSHGLPWNRGLDLNITIFSSSYSMRS